MSFIEWTPAMSVGSENFDDHHRMIIDCLNALHPLLGAEDRDDELRRVLDTLEDFVLVHFSVEEQAMKKAGYPDWRQHKEAHDQMYDVVFKMKADVEHGRLPNATQLFQMLNDWLVRHILGEDRKYMPYLANPDPTKGALWPRTEIRNRPL